VRETLVIDFNVALHAGIAKSGAAVKYGDLSNSETLHHLGLSHAKVIVCTIPDDLLRGIDNRTLVHVVREISPQAIIIANAINIDEIPAVYAAGANYVYLSRIEAAHTLEKAVNEALDDKIDVFRNKRQARNYMTEDRTEVLR
jgi:Trk K+ transport system NAD-binding subunit